MAEKKETKRQAAQQKRLNKIRAKNYQKKFGLDLGFEELVKLSVTEIPRSNINIIDIENIELNKDKTEKK